MCHILFVDIYETLDMMVGKNRREGEGTGLQGLIYEINDFPKQGEVWFIERAKN
jgi:hypothetical protein